MQLTTTGTWLFVMGQGVPFEIGPLTNETLYVKWDSSLSRILFTINDLGRCNGMYFDNLSTLKY